MASSSPSPLPQEILVNILTRLPMKSIIQVECVSKHWYALIRTPAFIAAHLRRSSLNRALILRHYHGPTSDSGITLLDSEEAIEVSDVPFTNSPPRFPKIVGSSNGLVCLDISSFFASDFVIWNPSTKNSRRLPPPSIRDCEGKRPWMKSLGFGFDEDSNDYNLARVVYFQDPEDELPIMGFEVFSWKKGYWKQIANCPSSAVIPEGSQPAIVEGSFHWIAFGAGNLARQIFILSYNMNKEEFSKTPLPISPRFNPQICMKVMACDGSLSLFIYSNANSIEYLKLEKNEDDGSDNVWGKVSAIQPLTRDWVPLAIWEDGKIVMRNFERSHLGGLFSYDSVSDQLERFPIKGIEHSYEVYNFVESLVPVIGDDHNVAENTISKA